MNRKIILIFAVGWTIICFGCTGTKADFKTWKVESTRVGGVTGGWTSSIESNGLIVYRGKRSEKVKVEESDLKKIKDLIAQLDLPNTNPKHSNDSLSCCDLFGETDQYVEFTTVTLDDQKFSSNKLELSVFQRITLWQLERAVSPIFEEVGKKILELELQSGN